MRKGNGSYVGIKKTKQRSTIRRDPCTISTPQTLEQLSTETRIKPDDVIMSSRGKIEILHQKESNYKRITSAAKKIIEENPYVLEARQRMQNLKEKQVEKSIEMGERSNRKRNFWARLRF